MKITTTIQDLNEHFDYYMINGERSPYDENGFGQTHNLGKALGFTLGRGKVKYWHLTLSARGFYYAYPLVTKDHYKRQLETGTEVTIHYETQDV